MKAKLLGAVQQSVVTDTAEDNDWNKSDMAARLELNVSSTNRFKVSVCDIIKFKASGLQNNNLQKTY